MELIVVAFEYSVEKLKLEYRKTYRVLWNTDHRLQCNEFVLGLFHGHWMLPKIFFWEIRKVVFKPINQGISEADQYESDPYPRACLTCYVMCCDLKECAFLTVNFFHFYFLLLTQNLFLFFILFLSIWREVRKPLFGNHKFLESRFPFILVLITLHSCIQQ